MCGSQAFASALEFKISRRRYPQTKSTLLRDLRLKFIRHKNLFSDWPTYVKEAFGEWAAEITVEWGTLFHMKTEEYILHLATTAVSAVRDKWLMEEITKRWNWKPFYWGDWFPTLYWLPERELVDSETEILENEEEFQRSWHYEKEKSNSF